MDDRRFDAIAKVAATGTSRRQILSGLLGGIGGGILSLLTVQPTAASPMPVPVFSQRDSRWGSLLLGDNPRLKSKKCAGGLCNIHHNGCFITSLSMLFNYYRASHTDPRKINARLRAEDGFQQGTGLLIWTKTNSVSPTSVSYSGGDANWERADRELTAGRPVLADVYSSKTKQHMIVLTGKTGTKYSFNDPWPIPRNARFSCVRDGNTLPCGPPDLAGTGYKVRTFRYFDGPARSVCKVGGYCNSGGSNWPSCGADVDGACSCDTKQNGQAVCSKHLGTCASVGCFDCPSGHNCVFHGCCGSGFACYRPCGASSGGSIAAAGDRAPRNP